MSRLDHYTNKSVYTILALQVFSALTLALIGQTWMMENVYNYAMEEYKNKTNKPQGAVYMYKELDVSKLNSFELYLQFAGTWFLMFTNYVPISLLMQLEICKFLSAFILSWDLQLYDSEQDRQMKV
jgi:hypothetical protein